MALAVIVSEIYTFKQTYLAKLTRLDALPVDFILHLEYLHYLYKSLEVLFDYNNP